MAQSRRFPRITDTLDLSASVRPRGRKCIDAPVENLSEGGMLIFAGRRRMQPAEISRFELAGPHFRYAGRAQVTHQEDGMVGLRFLSWEGSVNRSLRALVNARLLREHLAAHRALVDGSLIRQRVGAAVGTLVHRGAGHAADN
ncbi:MAG: PilZ domain-containing protein [Solirubrobacteraceae bacterium]|jgi:hypothetical protein